jgi:FemAB-related protein (PEP-CTERM system-associated)
MALPGAAPEIEVFEPPTEADEAAARAWDAYVEAHEDGSPYHLAVVRRIVAAAFGHASLHLAARRRGDAALAGVLPLVLVRSAIFGRYLVSLPFFNYGGILAGDDAARAALLAAAAERCRLLAARHIELRHVRPHAHLGLPARESKVAMILPLSSSAAELFGRLEGRVRNQIRQSQAAGLSVEEGHADKLDDFYRVFARNMRDLGTPCYPRRFFAAFLRGFEDRARIYVVRHPNGRPAAAAITLSWRGRTEVPWASSIRDYNPLRPNNLMYWTMIERAIERGERELDFGRSTEGGGTYRFKAGFGATPRRFYWHYYLPRGGEMPGLHPENPKFQAAIRVWRRMPVALTRLLGPPIVRGLP